jgi:hypothetical protein
MPFYIVRIVHELYRNCDFSLILVSHRRVYVQLMCRLLAPTNLFGSSIFRSLWLCGRTRPPHSRDGCFHFPIPLKESYISNTGSSKKNTGFIKTYHSELLNISNCGDRTSVLGMRSWWWIASDFEMLLSVDQSVKFVRKAGRQTSRAPLVLPPSASQCQARLKLKTKLRGFSPQANHTDRAAAACRRS